MDRPALSPRRRQRGVILIGSYLLLSIFLIYSNTVALRTFTHAKMVDQLRERVQALELAQGALEQLKEDVHFFLTTIVYEQTYGMNAVASLEWLDSLGEVLKGTAQWEQDQLLFNLPMIDRDADGLLTAADLPGDGQRDGTPQRPRCIALLPTITDASCVGTAQPVAAPRAWIVAIRKQDDPANPGTPDPNPLASRWVTLAAEANVGGVTKQVQATFEIALDAADLFHHAFFVNNYAHLLMLRQDWPIATLLSGEARSNGNMLLNPSDREQFNVLGDLYASASQELIDPGTQQPAAGTISGGRLETVPDLQFYWGEHSERERPARRMTFPNQPAVNSQTTILPYGHGWDSDWVEANPAQPQQRFAPTQPLPMPFLGELNRYESFAAQQQGTLTYSAPGADGLYGTADDTRETITAVHGSSDPLVLFGASQPIVVNGPVVVPGDVIIRGEITGRGTIYAGRNIHIVGNVKYEQPPTWWSLEREQETGRIRQIRATTNDPTTPWDETDLGSVCDDGQYFAPGVAPPQGCASGPPGEVPYGFALPGDPNYGFGYPAPKTRDLVSLAAKGNIVIGDYTWDRFQGRVVPALNAQPGSLTQPYVIDPSDDSLGYENDLPDAQGRPRFDGNYDQFDGGTKLDGSPRKFYESSLPDSEFQALVDPWIINSNGNIWPPGADPDAYPNPMVIDAVLFANHAVAGIVYRRLQINGAVIAHESALPTYYGIHLYHDIRLFDKDSLPALFFFDIARPALMAWQECTVTTPCP